eukprot:snap_masked-scaffold217_size252476-processed-gene-1.21 protein:Tk00469 transcript:snap_masked-scaffold217_size252476-processed-gene-1.21-mRNA-1 annotation:"rna-binding protein 5-like"
MICRLVSRVPSVCVIRNNAMLHHFLISCVWLVLVGAVYFTIYLWLNYGYKLLNKPMSCRTLLDSDDQEDDIGDMVHNVKSDLHKQNLEQWHKEHGKSSPTTAGAANAGGNAFQYRDRAKERRQKYGEADQPKPNRLKEHYLRSVEEAEAQPLPEKNIDGSNIGNRMLQKMGWKEGLGLGKSNQGRTSIIEADRRVQQAGLGSSRSVSTNPNESYKDCVKRTLFQRFQDLE